MDVARSEKRFIERRLVVKSLIRSQQRQSLADVGLIPDMLTGSDGKETASACHPQESRWMRSDNTSKMAGFPTRIPWPLAIKKNGRLTMRSIDLVCNFVENRGDQPHQIEPVRYEVTVLQDKQAVSAKVQVDHTKCRNSGRRQIDV